MSYASQAEASFSQRYVFSETSSDDEYHIEKRVHHHPTPNSSIMTQAPAVVHREKLKLSDRTAGTYTYDSYSPNITEMNGTSSTPAVSKSTKPPTQSLTINNTNLHLSPPAQQPRRTHSYTVAEYSHEGHHGNDKHEDKRVPTLHMNSMLLNSSLSPVDRDAEQQHQHQHGAELDRVPFGVSHSTGPTTSYFSIAGSNVSNNEASLSSSLSPPPSRQYSTIDVTQAVSETTQSNHTKNSTTNPDPVMTTSTSNPMSNATTIATTTPNPSPLTQNSINSPSSQPKKLFGLFRLGRKTAESSPTETSPTATSVPATQKVYGAAFSPLYTEVDYHNHVTSQEFLNQLQQSTSISTTPVVRTSSGTTTTSAMTTTTTTGVSPTVATQPYIPDSVPMIQGDVLTSPTILESDVLTETSPSATALVTPATTTTDANMDTSINTNPTLFEVTQRSYSTESYSSSSVISGSNGMNNGCNIAIPQANSNSSVFEASNPSMIQNTNVNNNNTNIEDVSSSNNNITSPNNATDNSSFTYVVVPVTQTQAQAQSSSGGLASKLASKYNALAGGNTNTTTTNTNTNTTSQAVSCRGCGIFLNCTTCHDVVEDDDIYSMIDTARDYLSEDETVAFYLDDKTLARAHVGQSAAGTAVRLERHGYQPGDAKYIARLLKKYKYNSRALRALGEEIIQRVGKSFATTMTTHHIDGIDNDDQSLEATMEQSYWNDYTGTMVHSSSSSNSSSGISTTHPPINNNLSTNGMNSNLNFDQNTYTNINNNAPIASHPGVFSKNAIVKTLDATDYSKGFSSTVLGPYTSSRTPHLGAKKGTSVVNVDDITTVDNVSMIEAAKAATTTTATTTTNIHDHISPEDLSPLILPFTQPQILDSESTMSKLDISNTMVDDKSLNQEIDEKTVDNSVFMNTSGFLSSPAANTTNAANITSNSKYKMIPLQTHAQTQVQAKNQTPRSTRSNSKSQSQSNLDDPTSLLSRVGDGTEESISGLSPIVRSKQSVEVRFAPTSLKNKVPPINNDMTISPTSGGVVSTTKIDTITNSSSYPNYSDRTPTLGYTSTKGSGLSMNVSSNSFSGFSRSRSSSMTSAMSGMSSSTAMNAMEGISPETATATVTGNNTTITTPNTTSSASSAAFPTSISTSPASSTPTISNVGTTTTSTSSTTSTSTSTSKRLHTSHLSDNGATVWVRTDALELLSAGSDFLHVGFTGYKTTTVSLTQDLCYLTWDVGSKVTPTRRSAAPLPLKNSVLPSLKLPENETEVEGKVGKGEKTTGKAVGKDNEEETTTTNSSNIYFHGPTRIPFAKIRKISPTTSFSSETDLVPLSELCDVENPRSRRIYEAMYNVRYPVSSAVAAITGGVTVATAGATTTSTTITPTTPFPPIINTKPECVLPAELAPGGSLSTTRRFIPIEAITAVVARPSSIRLRCLPASALPMMYSFSIYYEFPERIPLSLRSKVYNSVRNTVNEQQDRVNKMNQPNIRNIDNISPNTNYEEIPYAVRMVRKSLDLVAIDANIFALWVKGLALLRNHFENFSPSVVSSMRQLPVWLTLERKWPSILQITDIDSRQSVEKTIERLDMLEKAKNQQDDLDILDTFGLKSNTNNSNAMSGMNEGGFSNNNNNNNNNNTSSNVNHPTSTPTSTICDCLQSCTCSAQETANNAINSAISNVNITQNEIQNLIAKVYNLNNTEFDSIYRPPMTLRSNNKSIRIIGSPSLISHHDLVSIISQVPRLWQMCSWKQAYQMTKMGSGFDQFQAKINATRPRGCILLLRDSNNTILGAFTPESWAKNRGYFGNSSVYVFSTDFSGSTNPAIAAGITSSSYLSSPTISDLDDGMTASNASPTTMSTLKMYQVQGITTYYQFSDSKGFGVGGGGGVALFVDYELSRGHSEWCQSFMNPPLHRLKPKNNTNISTSNVNMTSDGSISTQDDEKSHDGCGMGRNKDKSAKNQFVIYDVEVWVAT